MYAVLEASGRVRLLGQLPPNDVAEYFAFKLSDWPAPPEGTGEGYVLEPDFAMETFRWVKQREPVLAQPSEQEDIAALLVDHEYRLTLLELGLADEGGDI